MPHAGKRLGKGDRRQPCSPQLHRDSAGPVDRTAYRGGSGGWGI